MRAAALLAAALLALPAPAAIADPLDLTAAAHGADPDRIPVVDYLAGLIADLRRDLEAANKAQDERLERIVAQAGHELDDHKVDDRDMSAAIRAVDARVSLINGINATVDALTVRVDRLATAATELQAAGQAAASAATANAVRHEESLKAVDVRLDDLRSVVDRNSDRLTKLETGGSQTAQEAIAAEAALAARVTAIESSASGANWVYQALLAIGGLLVGGIGVWAVLPRHPPPRRA